MPNITRNSRSTGIWTHLPSSQRSNWKRSFRMKRTHTNVPGRFRSKWRMVTGFSIQTMPVECWILFSIQSTTNLNTSVLMRWSGCWMPILFANQQMTMLQATSIQFQTCPEPTVWRTRLGPYGALWGGGFGILICQECWWWMKWVLARLSPQWQQQWYANCWLRKL